MKMCEVWKGTIWKTGWYNLNDSMMYFLAEVGTLLYNLGNSVIYEGYALEKLIAQLRADISKLEKLTE